MVVLAIQGHLNVPTYQACSDEAGGYVCNARKQVTHHEQTVQHKVVCQRQPNTEKHERRKQENKTSLL